MTTHVVHGIGCPEEIFCIPQKSTLPGGKTTYKNSSWHLLNKMYVPKLRGELILAQWHGWPSGKGYLFIFILRKARNRWPIGCQCSMESSERQVFMLSFFLPLYKGSSWVPPTHSGLIDLAGLGDVIWVRFLPLGPGYEDGLKWTLQTLLLRLA